MPEINPYFRENKRMFAKRMAGNKSSMKGMVGAAKRSIGGDMMKDRKTMMKKMGKAMS